MFVCEVAPLDRASIILVVQNNVFEWIWVS